MTERPRVELHDLDEIERPVIANQVGFGFGVYKDIHLPFDREGVAIVILVGVCRREPFGQVADGDDPADADVRYGGRSIIGEFCRVTINGNRAA